MGLKSSEKHAVWSATDADLWRTKLTTLDQVSEDVMLAWTWVLPLADLGVHKRYADAFISHAGCHPECQRAMSRLDGPNTHLPALFWKISDTVLTLQRYPERHDDYARTRSRPKVAEKLIDNVRKLVDSHDRLLKDTVENRDTLISRARAWGHDECWVDSGIERLQLAAGKLADYWEKVFEANWAFL